MQKTTIEWADAKRGNIPKNRKAFKVSGSR